MSTLQRIPEFQGLYRGIIEGVYLIEVRRKKLLLERLVGALREVWPKGLMVDAARTPALGLDWSGDPWGRLRVYESLEAHVAWQKAEQLTILGLRAAIKRGEVDPLRRVILDWTGAGITLKVGSLESPVGLALKKAIQEDPLDWQATTWFPE